MTQYVEDFDAYAAQVATWATTKNVSIGGTLAVTGAVSLSGALAVSGAVTGKNNVISGSGATVTLTAAQSGSVCLMDRAAGIVFTLPTGAAGLQFTFVTTVTVTSNAYKVITAAGTELLIGGVLSDDTDSSDALAMFNANGSTHVAISMNGTTTGGIIGTWFTLTCLSTTKWLINGIVNGSSTVATPFATS